MLQLALWFGGAWWETKGKGNFSVVVRAAVTVMVWCRLERRSEMEGFQWCCVLQLVLCFDTFWGDEVKWKRLCGGVFCS